MSGVRKFTAEADAAVLDGLQQLAAWEGHEFQAVLDEALREHLHRKRRLTERAHVLEAFIQSLRDRDELYRALAK